MIYFKKLRTILFIVLNLIVLIPAGRAFAEDHKIKPTQPVVIAVRKFQNFAGEFAENGVIEGVNGEKIRVGFWKPSFEIKLAEVLTNELANTGHFTVVERSNLYEVLGEQTLAGANKRTSVRKNNLTQAKYIIIASLSDYIPNTSGARNNSDGRVLVFRTGKDRTKVDTYVAIDVRVINTSTGSIAFSRTIEGTTSSVSKADRSGLALGIIDTISEKRSFETTSATRALRAALIKVVEYLDCHLYLKDQCINEFQAEELKRKEATKGSLSLF